VINGRYRFKDINFNMEKWPWMSMSYFSLLEPRLLTSSLAIFPIVS
jgi:hypothetical protein